MGLLQRATFVAEATILQSNAMPFKDNVSVLKIHVS